MKKVIGFMRALEGWGIKKACIENGFYTAGCNEDYEKCQAMGGQNVDDKRLLEIAEDIYAHTSESRWEYMGEDVKEQAMGAILWALNRECRIVILWEDEMDWEKAGKYLQDMIEEYARIGAAGIPALCNVLFPYKRRLEAGERSRDLYDDIMAVE